MHLCLFMCACVCACTCVYVHAYAVCVLSVAAQKSRPSTAFLDVTGDERLGSFKAGTMGRGYCLGSVTLTHTLASLSGTSCL